MKRQIEKATQKVDSTVISEIGPKHSLLSSLWRIIGVSSEQFEQWLVDSPKAAYGSAVARILLGTSGVGVLVVNFPARHYIYGAGSFWNDELNNPQSDFPELYIFSAFRAIADNATAFTALYLVAILVALIVTVGWRTRVFMPAHLVLYVSLIELNDSVSDQSDNAYRIFVLLLIFTRCSGRLSLDARRFRRQGREFVESPAWLLNALHNLALIAIIFQVCAIYVYGGFYKLGGESWQQGYAAYLPLQTAQFGTWPEISQLITAWGPAVAIATWGSIWVQIFFPVLLLRRSTRVIGLVSIFVFHSSVGFLMGIPWFSLIMISVDAILIRDVTYRQVGNRIRPIVDSWGLHRTPSASSFEGGTIHE